MTVQQMIDVLSRVEDKTRKVKAFETHSRRKISQLEYFDVIEVATSNEDGKQPVRVYHNTV